MSLHNSVPSTSSEQSIHFVDCKLCGKKFSRRGINIHLARSHGSSQDDESIQSTELKNQLQCPHCGKFYNRLKSHIFKAHPEVYRKNLVKTYVSKSDISIDSNNANAPKKFPTQTVEINSKLQNLRSEVNSFVPKFEALLNNDPNVEEFNNLYNTFTATLCEMNNSLPGPKHPATKFFEMRKRQKIFANNDRKYNNTSNPERRSKRDRKKRQEKYNYDLIQYQYFNERKKCIHNILNDKTKNNLCQIPINVFKEAMDSKWGIENNAILDNYNIVNVPEQDAIDSDFQLSEMDVKISLQKMKSDSAPGPDRILIRTLKLTECSLVIYTILQIMFKWNIIPEGMREARTIMIYKDKGDQSNPLNWRPISVCSVIRRLIEKVLDSKLRQYIYFNENQRGFVNQPGTFLNVSLIDGCLKKAKLDKSNISIVMLDVSQAFDNVGHNHLAKCLDSEILPTPLRNLVQSLITNNYTKLHVAGKVSEALYIKKGVFQGSPLSPTFFNLSIDFILKELSERDVSNKYGFEVLSDLDRLSVTAFADDIAIISKSLDAAQDLVLMTRSLLQKVGLQLNAEKSSLINIQNGMLTTENLVLDEESCILGIGSNETIKYLGVTFNNEIKFESDKIISLLRNDLEILVSTPMLRPDQKLNVVNQYLWPKVVYSLQMAPLHKLSLTFLEDIDKIIRSSVKEMLFLPADVPNNMLYSSRKVRGLALVRAKWESFLQHCNTCILLIKANNPYINTLRPLNEEIQTSCDILQLSPPEEYTRSSVKKLRQTLQAQEYDKWKSLSGRGKGVVLFSEVTESNKWISNKSGLSTSEWISCLKMNVNLAAVRAIPGRSLDGIRCRRGCSENESLAHVLGFCDRGMLLRNTRHHIVRSKIAAALKNEGWQVQEEVHCIALDGSSRRVDILAMSRNSKKGIIIDPTIRMEQGHGQPEEVDAEKKRIYEPTIPYFLDKYHLDSIQVVGLLIGARGTIPKFFENFRKKYKLPLSLRDDIVLSVLKKSCQILHNHIYILN